MAGGEHWLAAMRCKRQLADGVQASAGGWRALAGGDEIASVGWQMDCKRPLEDGERRLSAEMMRALAGRWSASVGWWWRVLAGRWRARVAQYEFWWFSGVQWSFGGF